MKVTVCELPNDSSAFPAHWKGLGEHLRQQVSELVLLPEMPFWFWQFGDRNFHVDSWDRAVRGHAERIARLGELGCPTVVSTRPVVEGAENKRFNEGYVWQSNNAVLTPVHRKRYLPDEKGFWEASWYSPGDDGFEAFDGGSFKLGFAICTELWFTQHAREYGQRGVQLLACPRATLAATTDKWLAGARTAAVVSGAFCLSSNFSKSSGEPPAWGGTGWIIEPEEGEVLGATSPAEPFLTLDIDVSVADRAKKSYPRYVRG